MHNARSVWRLAVAKAPSARGDTQARRFGTFTATFHSNHNGMALFSVAFIRQLFPELSPVRLGEEQGRREENRAEAGRALQRRAGSMAPRSFCLVGPR